MTQLEIQTARLLLRPFTVADAGDVARLAGDRAIAEMTLAVPHPYTPEMGVGWIRTHREQFEKGAQAVFAITDRENGSLVGAIGLEISPENMRAELGYWIGRPYWGQGYCTEAARAVLAYGFHERGLVRIYATHFTRNPASGRVMAKIGMRHEGCLRQHVRKWDGFEDMEVYGILAAEFEDGMHTPTGR